MSTLKSVVEQATKEKEPFVAPYYYPIALGWRILIRPIPLQRVTKGGIALPDQVIDNSSHLVNIAQVVSMGELCYTHPQFLGKRLCEPGDWVVYGQYGGVGHYIKLRVPDGVTDEAEVPGRAGERVVFLRSLNDTEIASVLPEGPPREAVMTVLD